MSEMRILLVGESRVQNTVLKKRLPAEYQIHVEQTGTEAIELLKSGEKFNITILDFKKPFSDAFALLQYIEEKKVPGKILGISSEPRAEIEPQAILLGIDYFLPKPLLYDSLINLLARWDSGVKIVQGIIAEGDLRDKMPFFTIKRCCYICGYEDVKMHIPLEEGFTEDWSNGLFPLYSPRPGFEKWDFLRSMVAVCPYCCFASSKIEDWSEEPGRPFPYKSDAKKILSRTIASRKKLVGSNSEVDRRFDTPNRSPELTILSFKLAEKCVSALILGEKKGTHSQLGFYNTTLGCINSEPFHDYFRESVENFTNQLKMGEVNNADKVMTYFFLISLKLFLGESETAKRYMHELSDQYSEKGEGDIGEEEKIWLQRVSIVWKNGIDTDAKRRLEFS